MFNDKCSEHLFKDATHSVFKYCLVRRNPHISFLTPFFSPWVFCDPFSRSIHCLVPSNQFDQMVSVEFEWLWCSMVWTFLVCKEISERNHLGDNRSVCEDFTFNVLFLDSDAKILKFVDLVLNTAFVGFEMVNFTFLFLSSVGHALFCDKSLLSSPVENFVGITSFTSILTGITLDKLLSW